MPFIKLENLQHCFADGTIGLKNINLNIQRGEFVILAGTNGSGKTTLLRHLNGLLFPTSGNVLIDDVPVKQDLIRARQIVGMVFQDADSQIIGETVHDDVAFGPENLNLPENEVRKRVSKALKDVGLENLAGVRPLQLSGGEKRRLAVAGVLAMEPELIIFDEPFSNLDYPGIVQVLKQIIDLHHSNHTIIVTTHDLEKIIAHANRLIVMKSGRIVGDGLPDQLINKVEQFGIRTPCAVRFGRKVDAWLN